MIDRVIHKWEDGTVFYTNEDNEYCLDGVWGTAKVSIVRTPVGNFASSSNKDVPKSLLLEIGYNLK